MFVCISCILYHKGEVPTLSILVSPFFWGFLEPGVTSRPSYTLMFKNLMRHPWFENGCACLGRRSSHLGVKMAHTRVGVHYRSYLMKWSVSTCWKTIQRNICVLNRKAWFTLLFILLQCVCGDEEEMFCGTFWALIAKGLAVQFMFKSMHLFIGNIFLGLVWYGP